MKKLLALVLILGMASMASAALQISVGGNQEPVDSEITIAPSDELILDIWTDAAITPGGNATWALTVDTTKGDISGGTALLGSPYILIVQGETENFASVIPPTGEEGVWGSLLNGDFVGGSSIPAGTTLFDDFLFHCVGEGDAVINLFDNVVEGTPMGNPVDSVIIHQQIPEPMTLSLLGLGGLGLLRRRRA